MRSGIAMLLALALWQGLVVTGLGRPGLSWPVLAGEATTVTDIAVPPPDGRLAEGAEHHKRGIPVQAQQLVVVRTVDGDSIEARARAPGPVVRSTATVRVRLIAVDTPETGEPPECHADQAARLTAALLPVGSAVWALADVDPRDRFGRDLLYLWNTDGVFVNREIVARGAGRAMLVEPNHRFTDMIIRAEADARAAARGLWLTCPTTRSEAA